MIKVFSENKLELLYDIHYISHLDDLESDTKVLICDISNVTASILQELHEVLPKLKIIILANTYCRDEARLCFENHVYHYLFDLAIIQDHLNALLASFHKKDKILNKVSFDDTALTFDFADNEIKLTKKEYLILKHLFENYNNIVSHNVLLTQVLGYHEDSQTRLVAVYVRYLRKKLSTTDYDIETICKEGYRLKMR